MANQLILDRALDANGYVAPGAKATVFADGTSTLISVYSDAAGTIATANPIVADADGFWPQRYVNEDAKVVVTDADDVALYTLDPAPVSQGTGSAAANVAFTPSVAVPHADVQSAIDYVAATAISGVTSFGIGVTGNAPLLADLDATATASGVYRFDGATTGTFPTGVLAGDTGALEWWRQSSTTAKQELHHATTNRVFVRRMTASVWGAWREVVNVNQATAEGDMVYRGPSDFARLAKGTAGQVLRMNTGETAPEWGGGSGSIGPIATTSGTNIDLTGVPSTANQVIVVMNSISMSAVANILIRPRASGAIVITGYQTGLFTMNGGGTSWDVDSTQIRTRSLITAGSTSGMLIFNRIPGGNFWTFTGSARCQSSIGIEGCYWSGGVDVAATLEGIAISTTAGAFDQGQVALYWSA